VANELAREDARVRVIDQPNAGVGAARNRALASATGRYVAVIDSDDLWVEDKLEAQLALAGERVVVIGGVRRFRTEAGNRVWGMETLPPAFRPDVPAWLNVALLPSTSMVLINTMLAPRACVEQVKGWNEQLRTAEDWDLWLRLACHCTFRFIERPLQMYRKHSASLTADKSPAWGVERHIEILRAFAADGSGIPRSHITRATIVRLLEGAAVATWSHDTKVAVSALLRAAAHPQAWTMAGFYRQTAQTVLDSCRFYVDSSRMRAPL